MAKTASTDEVVDGGPHGRRGRRLRQPGHRHADDAARVRLASGRNLTDREVEILRLLATGQRIQDISETLFLSPKTVKNHLTSVYAKLDVETAAQAVAEAYRWGWSRPRDPSGPGPPGTAGSAAGSVSPSGIVVRHGAVPADRRRVSSRSPGARLGGDFSAFYGAGELARSGAADSLLDVAAQYRAQQAYTTSSCAPFPYPPVFGFLFVPLSLLPFTVAYAAVHGRARRLGGRSRRAVLDVLERQRSSVAAGGPARRRDVGADLPVGRGGTERHHRRCSVLAAGFRLLQHRRDQAARGSCSACCGSNPSSPSHSSALLVVARRWRQAGAGAARDGGADLGPQRAGLRRRHGPSGGGSRSSPSRTRGTVVQHRARRSRPSSSSAVACQPRQGRSSDSASPSSSAWWPSSSSDGSRPRPSCWPSLCAALVLTAIHALPYDLVLLIPVDRLRDAGQRSVWTWPSP